jgi:hypothetical protein
MSLRLLVGDGGRRSDDVDAELPGEPLELRLRHGGIVPVAERSS